MDRAEFLWYPVQRSGVEVRTQGHFETPFAQFLGDGTRIGNRHIKTGSPGLIIVNPDDKCAAGAIKLDWLCRVPLLLPQLNLQAARLRRCEVARNNGGKSPNGESGEGETSD